ncbi:MAG: YlxR family protein [Chloroflexi bacterium]|nr:YlxR family protein [Chloroflexota bacterium]
MKSSSQRTPQRTCVACRQVRPKRELVRLVRTADGRVEVDASGKRPGRGGYICPARQCWELGLKGSRVEHTLHTSLTAENREQLIKYGEGAGQITRQRS